MSTEPLQFWFEFVSTYSYPAAMRVERVAARAGVAVRWRPFLLGPIFAAQGWRDSPFKIYPAKGRYMWRDLERVCAVYRANFAPSLVVGGELFWGNDRLEDALAWSGRRATK